MILKPLKYLLFLLLALIMLALLAFSYLIYTKHGSRVAIDFALKQSAVDVRYQNISGTLANGLKFNQIEYQDQAVTVHVNQLEYQASWSLLSRFVDVSNMQINQVEVRLKQTETVDEDYQPFAGFQWPFTLDLRNLIINDLTIHTADNIQEIASVKLETSAFGYTTEVKKLQIQAADWTLNSNGKINSKDGLNYDLSPSIVAKTTEWQADASGTIKGDLHQLQLKQQIIIEHPQITGQWSVNGSIDKLLTEPVLDINVSAPEATVDMENQPLLLKEVVGTINGSTEDLKLNLKSIVKTGDLPPAQLLISGQGSGQQFQVEQVQLITDEGAIEFTGEANWQNDLLINGQLQLKAFNPSQLFAEWPGELNGNATFNLRSTSDDLFISSKNNQIEGQLKNQPFTLSGEFEYAKQQIKANQLMLNLGQNTIQANGIISAAQVNMSASLNWIDLTLLDDDLNGQLKGTLNLSGDHENPEILADIEAINLKFQDIQAKQMALTSQGLWQQDIQTEINISDLTIKNHPIDQLKIKQQGWLDQHQIDLDARHDNLNQVISLTGTYDHASQRWQGTLQQHQLSVSSGETIQLMKPVAIDWADSIHIEPGCWKGVAEGTLCMELAKTTQQLSADLSVDALSLAPFQMFLPDGLELIGLANGSANIVMINNELSMKSNLNINDGLLKIGQTDIQKQEVAITTLQLLANSEQTNSVIEFTFTTIDNDSIKGQAQITQDNQQQWSIDGTLSGNINNTAIIKAFTSEISELEGTIVLDGSIQGPLQQPELKLNFTQPSGYLRLSRMGTVIEQLDVQVTTTALQQPKYHIRVSGQNLATINQGNFTSEGELTLTQAGNNNSQWHYQGQLSGDNFMIFNIPELKLHVSPQLDIIADQQNMSVQGDLLLNQGRVVVEQLPPETVANSSDLVIHSEDKEPSMAYPITFDINAIIGEGLELDVIGLQALLKGSMQLKQQQNQPVTAKGTLNLEDGLYEVYGQKLDINTGEMIFNGPVDNPKLNVKASRKSLDGTVIAGVQLGGTVNNLQSELYSEPSLSDIEILSYIMTGNGINQAGSINGEQLKQTAILLGLNQGAPVFRQIQNTFGIDVLTIKEAADAEYTVIEAGKKVSDKLYIAYNHGIFNRLGFWVLKYKLNEFLNLQTTQGEDQSIELVYTRKARTEKRKN